MKAAAPRRRVDILAVEKAKGLSTEAYLAGCSLRDLFERAHATGGQTWGDRVDASRDPGAAAAHAHAIQKQITSTMVEVEREVGPHDAARLKLLLEQGLTFAELAATEGKSGEREVAYVARRVRDALQALGRKYIAVGRSPRKAVENSSSHAGRRNRGGLAG